MLELSRLLIDVLAAMLVVAPMAAVRAGLAIEDDDDGTANGAAMEETRFMREAVITTGTTLRRG